MTALRIIVVGAGLIGRQRAAAIESLAARHPIALAGVVDPRADAADGLSAPHFRHLSEVPPGSFDAAVVALPHDLSASTCLLILQAGCPVLVEKPLGTSGREARTLAEAAARLRIPSFVGYNYRFLPGVAAAVRALEDGSLGRLRTLDMLLAHGGNPRSAEGWKLQPERAGGGVILDPGVHLLDILLRIAPGVRCTAIAATRGFWKTGIEEDAVALFEDDGLIATVRVSHIRWSNAFRIELHGEDGYAIVDGRGGNYGNQTIRIGARWAWEAAGGRSQQETESATDFGSENRSLEQEVEAVVRRWLGEQPGGIEPATPAEAVAVAELCEELYAKLADGDRAHRP